MGPVDTPLVVRPPGRSQRALGSVSIPQECQGSSRGCPSPRSLLLGPGSAGHRGLRTGSTDAGCRGVQNSSKVRAQPVHPSTSLDQLGSRPRPCDSVPCCFLSLNPFGDLGHRLCPEVRPACAPPGPPSALARGRQRVGGRGGAGAPTGLVSLGGGNGGPDTPSRPWACPGASI